MMKKVLIILKFNFSMFFCQYLLYAKKPSPNLKSEILTYYIFFCDFIFHVGFHLWLVLISFLCMRKGLCERGWGDIF